jgi:hypothetical protein
MDSISHKDKKACPTKKSKRGSKKTEEKTKKTSLENSLSDMLIDDDDDDEPRSQAKESLTVSTKDSLQREKEKSSSPHLKKSSKRGGKRSSSSKNEDPTTSLSLKGSPAPAPPTLGATLSKLGGPQRDFGRHADDNDTFCGLGTVGEKELARGSHASKPNTLSPKKTKIIAPPPVVKPRVQAMPSPFMMSSNDDSDSEDEEDLFQGFSGSNPFRMPSYL